MLERTEAFQKLGPFLDIPVRVRRTPVIWSQRPRPKAAGVAENLFKAPPDGRPQRSRAFQRQHRACAVADRHAAVIKTALVIAAVRQESFLDIAQDALQRAFPKRGTFRKFRKQGREQAEAFGVSDGLVAEKEIRLAPVQGAGDAERKFEK